MSKDRDLVWHNTQRGLDLSISVNICCRDKASNEQFLFETYLTLKPFFRIVRKYKTQF